MADEVAQHPGIQLIETVAQPRLSGGMALGLLLRLFQGVLVDLLLVQQEVAQQGHQGDGNDQGAQDQEGDGQAEVVEEHPSHAAGQP